VFADYKFNFCVSINIKKSEEVIKETIYFIFLFFVDISWCFDEIIYLEFIVSLEVIEAKVK
jgi:hypothetical protein